jgi:glycerol-3-phosphate acyltransferase PlsX
MSEKIRVALDAMGGDLAPAAPVEGAVIAVKENKDLTVVLVGKEDTIKAELSKYDYPKDQIEIVNATEVIVTGEPPVKSIQEKKDSSLVVAMKKVRAGEADALVTAGNTGSVLVGGQTIVRREKGVSRAPIGTAVPTEKGVALIVDAGANVDAKPENLVQFAIMGSVYMEKALKINSPKVGLLNVGAEEEKGNALTKEVYQLLKKRKDINFIGNIEGNEISKGKADVIVCDAFAGNILLKMYEGVSKTFLKLIKETFMSSFKSKIGALLVKGSLKETLKVFDVEKYGGAPLLGLSALVVKAHGNSKAPAFATAIKQCISFKEAKINEIIREKINMTEE